MARSSCFNTFARVREAPTPTAILEVACVNFAIFFSSGRYFHLRKVYVRADVTDAAECWEMTGYHHYLLL